ncbi:MAG: hypothetical protein AAGF66_16825 [Cyanobacteria bacterium P01_H01_bin.119]
MQPTRTLGTWLFFCLTLSFVCCERPYGGPSRMDDRALRGNISAIAGADV